MQNQSAFTFWEVCFLQRQRRFLQLRANQQRLTPKERNLVVGPIQQFEHNEQSDGSNLRRFALFTGQGQYVASIKLFAPAEQAARM